LRQVVLCSSKKRNLLPRKKILRQEKKCFVTEMFSEAMKMFSRYIAKTILLFLSYNKRYFTARKKYFT